MYKNQSSSANCGEQLKHLRAIDEGSFGRNNNTNNSDMRLVPGGVFVNLATNILKPNRILTPLFGGVTHGVNKQQSPNVKQSRNYSKGPQKQKLLRFPAFPLEETMERFLKSVEPLLTKQELKETTKIADRFLCGEGEVLQNKLEDVASHEKNWLAKRWLNTAYLRYRDPVTVYSSPGMTFPLQKFADECDWLLYTSKVIYGLINYKQLIDEGKIPVVKMGKHELDNSQFHKVYGTCRIPIYKEDKLEYHPNSTHVVVIYKNHFYKLEVYDAECKQLHPEVLADKMQKIVTYEQGKGIPFGILTTNERDSWSVAYEQLQKKIENRESISVIEKSLFTVSLDECVPFDENNVYNVLSEQLIHGGGKRYNSGNRWMDKTIQLIVNPNGMSGFTYEHSPAEGQPIAQMCDYVVQNLANDKFYADASRCDESAPQKLKLSRSSCLDDLLAAAERNVNMLAKQLHIHVLKYDGYGKEFLKAQKLSPDSFVQIALQYAFYKIYKVPAAQYESAHLRIYIGGRTETIRSCSNESLAFSKAMCEDKHSNEERVQLLRKAVEGHRAYTMLALQGRGVDRHLLGLKLMAIEQEMPVPKFFSSPGWVKSTYFRISTSQVATPNEAFMCYGPSVKDGYSCCYNPRPCDIICALGSWHDCQDTCSKRFAVALTEAFDSMENLLLTGGSKLKAKL